MSSLSIPHPSLVVLVGPPASGKSTWAAENFRPDQVVSSDSLRAVVGEHELDLDATEDAFDLIERIVELRSGRKLTTVVDTTGLDATRRGVYLAAARQHKLNAVAVRFNTSGAECKRRNRERAHPVPAKALDAMVKKAKAVTLDSEGWDLVIEPQPVRTVTPKLAKVGTAEDLGTSERQTNLRFGLHISSFDWPGDTEAIGPTLARVAAEAEDAGFDSLWVMDHMIQIPQVGSAWDPMLDSYTTLGFLANATSRIRLGVLVSAVTFRNIGHLAKMIATLDVLSGGRAIAGLGAANSQREHEAYGWKFPPASERLALLEDALQALPLFWAPGGKPFKGRVLNIPEAVGYPRPIQDHVPIVVGGSGPKVTLRLAAQYADGCNLFGDTTAVAKKVAVLHQHCAELGRDPAEVEVTHLGTILLGSDTTDLNERVHRLRPANQGPDRYAASVSAGTIDDHEAGFRALQAAGVQTAIVSTPEVATPGSLDAFAELIARFGS